MAAHAGSGVVHLFERMTARGLLHCTSPGAAAALAAASASGVNGQPLSLYAGFDPTGPSLHLGHLAVVMAMRRLQEAGIRPIALIGGATALIGDPSGKSADRPLLAQEVVSANAEGIRKCLEGLLEFGSAPAPGAASPPVTVSPASTGRPGRGALLVNNADFYAGMNVLDFMRAVGTRFRLSAMLNKDSVKSRLGGGGTGDGLSYCEFSYQVFQAFDFWTLWRTRRCLLQVGGADQWGNITAGIEYVRRAAAAAAAPASATQATGSSSSSSSSSDVHGATVPLLTTSSGAKFGKSEGNADPVWLDPGRTSHHALYQYLLATPDADAPRLLRLLTDLPEEQLRALETEDGARPEGKAAACALATEVTRLVRGDAGLAAAQASAVLLFGGGGGAPRHRHGGGGAPSPDGSSEPPSSGSSSGCGSLSAADILALVEGGQLPCVALHADAVFPGAPPHPPPSPSPSPPASLPMEVCEAAVAVGLASSKAEARRLVAARGLYLNSRRVEDPRRRLVAGDFLGGQVALLGAGKKSMAALRLLPL